MARAGHALNDRLSIALGSAAGVLAIRGIGLLTGVLQTGGDAVAGIVQETAILVVSASILAAFIQRKSLSDGILENSHILLDQSPNPIMIKRAGGEYIYMNPSFEAAFECSANDLIGKNAQQLWDENLSTAAQEGDIRTLQTGKPSFYKIDFSLKDGQLQHWLISKFIMPMSDDDPCIATVYTNVTEQVRIETRLADSEARYALASLHAGIWDWNIQTGSLYVSPAFLELLGQDKDDSPPPTPETILRLFHPDDYAGHKARLRAHFQDPTQPYINDHRYKMPDGRYKWFRAVGRSVIGEDGKTIRMVGMITDIYRERQVIEALRMSEARISTLLDNSPAPIYFKDKDLRFVMINRRCEEVYRVRAADVLGKTSEEVFQNRQGVNFVAHDREVIQKRSLITHEEIVNGTTFLTTKFPIFDDEGKLIGIGGIETDITERVTVEKAYRKARDDAEMANRSKSAFLANMSHELRTPLNSIIGFSDSLLAGTLGNIENPLHREYLAIIRTGGEHLLQLINDILDLSRIEAGKLQLDESTIDLVPVCNEVIRLTAEQAGSEGLYIDADLPKDLPKLYADERQLKQVLINLLSNAIKFTEPGGRVIISAKHLNDGRLEIRISDTGVGIDAENLKLVQQPFVQVADAMTRKHRGSGLGLAIVNSIILMHGGAFTLESQPGIGTSAIITMPAARVIDSLM